MFRVSWWRYIFIDLRKVKWWYLNHQPESRNFKNTATNTNPFVLCSPPSTTKKTHNKIHTISILNGRKVATTTTQKQQQWIFNRNIHLNNNILWTKLLETWTWNTRKPTFIYHQKGSDHQKRSNGIENCAKALLVGRIQWNSIPIQFEGKKKMTGCCWIVY